MENQQIKTVYFVRHGESEANMAGVHQDGTTPLTDKGVRQAELLAERLRSLPIELILASTFERARRTADIINGMLEKPIHYTKLLRETHPPSEYNGKRTDDPSVVNAHQLFLENRYTPGWRYSDEENFDDRKKRALEIISYILTFPEDHILVVTHGNITRCVVAGMLYGDKLQRQAFYPFQDFLLTVNTGVTVCKYLMEEKQWRLLTWNDQAHLS